MSEKLFEKPEKGQPWDVIIIGSGPSAFTASIYTTRGAASTLMLAGSIWGGQLMLTTEVDNFPGFPNGIEGPELMAKMRAQAERFNTEIIEEDVIKVDFASKPFSVKTQNGEYISKSIIIATGSATKWLEVPGEKELMGRGISSCAPCDAPFFKNKKVAVIGGGDSAMEEALVLSKYAASVSIIHRRDSFRASQAMQQRVNNDPKIDIIWNSEVEEFKGEGKLEKIVLKNVKNNEKTEIAFDGAFVAIGHLPATSIFSRKISLDNKGYIQKSQKEGYSMSTNVEGVFVAGDVHDYHYRQAITASAYGCMAAMDTLKWLDKTPPTY